ncbi:hypothetical protein PZ938_15380 [Luteipulveratus sp. YIM 133132]|uniref:hypothetical protein n=1 Tax=Luteipulveratus flavus TaxID=3031728 RepID=UPI0023B196DC|nr:hypothetical protein [Luteipulveratus sp. YIM 133132]MDE9366997.1 hypothetical protein [Luteipulveratus sp. YIM 133132]
MTFPHLPGGLGEMASFDSEDDGTQISTTVWESPVPEGSAVDLSVTVVRSERFTDPQAFHDWLVPWQERPAEEAAYEATTINGRAAWLGRDQVLWLVRPGLGATATVDATRIDAASLPSLAQAAHETGSEAAATAK